MHRPVFTARGRVEWERNNKKMVFPSSEMASFRILRAFGDDDRHERQRCLSYLRVMLQASKGTDTLPMIVA